jgi:hypothetical protein
MNPGSQFGQSAAGAGDMNGDGFAEVLVGEPGATDAWLFYGRAGGIPSGSSSTGVPLRR